MFYNLLHKSEVELQGSSRGQSGQAMMELAIFGSLILLLLATLISYGLKYDFQQQADMEAFRTAEWLAVQRDDEGQPQGSSQYMVVKDRHTPDPGNPFGVGSVSTVMSQAAVTRDYRQDTLADNYEGLPKLHIRFQSNVDGNLENEDLELATAGIKHVTVSNITPSASEGPTQAEDGFNMMKEKYRLTFGDVSGWCDPEDNFVIHCMRDTDESHLIIYDSVEGEIVDYQSAIRQARMLVDPAFFVYQCEAQQKPEHEYTCQQIWDSCEIEQPWYLEGAYMGDTELFGYGSWHFPWIERLFVLPGTSSAQRNIVGMGLQPDTRQTVDNNLRLHKDENSAGITTADNAAFSTVTQRQVYANWHLDRETGRILTPRNRLTVPFSTERSDSRGWTWQTPQ